VKGDLFLDIFGGTCGVAKSVCRAGPTAAVLDLIHGYDLLAPGALTELLSLLRQSRRGRSRVRGVCLASPCESFSIARRAPPSSPMPSAVRSKEFIWGLPDLPKLDAALCETGNQLCRATARIIRVCEANGIAWILENPASSMLWSAPPIARLLQKPNVCFTTIHQCMYGTPWKKPTGLAMGGGLRPSPHLSCKCVYTGKRCSRTGQPHIVLSGLANGAFKTLAAKEYPKQLCDAIMKTFQEWWRTQYIAHWTPAFCR
jgi:hypothetical protein